jgi:hypothetical protein
MSVETMSAEAAYLSKSNIVRPDHPDATKAAADATAAEAKARADIGERYGHTITGGSIKRGK